MNLSQTVRNCWQRAQQQLIDALGLDAQEARLEAQLLLQTVLKADHAWLIAHGTDDLHINNYDTFHTLLLRRLQGEPIAYILGYREFYGMALQVTQATLIPRPDTETLVEAALAKISEHAPADILDLGTGTGAIALAIAQQRPQVNITAIDASEAALKVAQGNAKNLAIVNVNFQLSDWFSVFTQDRFDVIVSNPPYIKQDDAHLGRGDLRFEPLNALASGRDGLDDIRRIINDCLAHLKPQGWLMLEHGYNQSQAVQGLMAGNGLVSIQTIQDLGGNDRVTLGRNPLIVTTHWG